MYGHIIKLKRKLWINTRGEIQKGKIRTTEIQLHIGYWRILGIRYTGCSLNIFFLKILWFFWTLSVLLPRWCCTCLVCVYTHWHQGKTEKGQSREYSKIFGKNTIFNEHPVHDGYVVHKCIYVQFHTYVQTSIDTYIHKFITQRALWYDIHTDICAHMYSKVNNADLPHRLNDSLLRLRGICSKCHALA